MIFVNLPVRDLAASTAFYVALGGEMNKQFSDEHTTSVMLSDAIGVMLLTHDRYRIFTSRPIGDAVNATVARAVAAGGSADPNPVQDHGFMFGRSAEDPNGYVWEIVWMDPAAHARASTN
jgi:uncharacterized protein